jgi:hypothetical protein
MLYPTSVNLQVSMCAVGQGSFLQIQSVSLHFSVTKWPSLSVTIAILDHHSPLYSLKTVNLLTLTCEKGRYLASILK